MSLDDRLTRLFRVVRAEARRNPDFAKQLEEAIGPAETPAAALTAAEFDPVSIVRTRGEEALRDALIEMSRAAIYAAVQSRSLEPAGTSSFNKARLIEHVVAAARRASAPRKSPLDY